MDSDVLVIGAGLAGATAARSLVDAGLRVIALDKGRGPGGRLSTRRVAEGTFDHGAAVVQASGEPFRRWLSAQTEAGNAAPCRGGWVGVPGMNALVAATLETVDVRWQSTVASLHFRDGRWDACDSQDGVLARASQLILAIPAPQAALLLRSARLDALAPMLRALDTVRYAPCWAGLFIVEELIGDAPGSENGASNPAPGACFEAIYREADKPGRTSHGHWVAHAGAGWSEEHLELDAAEAAQRLLREFLRVTGLDAARVRSASAHRWRYAKPRVGLGDEAYENLAEGCSGVWLAGDMVRFVEGDGVSPAERAWRSGREAAEAVRAASHRSVVQPKS